MAVMQSSPLSANQVTDLLRTNASPATAPVVDEVALIRAAAELTRDLNTANPRIFWTDFLMSAGLGYAALAVAIMAVPTWVMLFTGMVSVLALYRAGSFIHELTHLKPSAVPGFRMAWNMIVGIPLMVPSFMYEGVHNLHHAKIRYGTAQDPEYLPLALMRPHTLLLFMAASFVAPIALIARFAVLAPLSAVFPGLRKMVVERYSALAINPAFRRKPPEGPFRRTWLMFEIAVSIWAIGLLAGVAFGWVPLRGFLIFLGVAACVAVLNQVRTLVAHLWGNDGDAISVTAQYLDSVNVPPPALLPVLWAPVGLRYHAIHHLLPGIPYHALGEAHRRLSAAMPQDSAYHRANYTGLSGLIVRLARGSAKA
jgi:fatty acid desaturase